MCFHGQPVGKRGSLRSQRGLILTRQVVYLKRVAHQFAPYKPLWRQHRRKARRQQKKADLHRPLRYRKSPDYLRCLPIRPAISNIETCALPKISFSLASALIMRLLTASCSLFFLM